MKITTLLVGAMLIAGIPASGQSKKDVKHTQECQRKHPKWELRDCERITFHQVWVGMTADMVTASLGTPIAVNSTQIEGRAVMQLVYERGGRAGQFRAGATQTLAPRVYVYIDSKDCGMGPGDCKVSSIQETSP